MNDIYLKHLQNNNWKNGGLWVNFRATAHRLTSARVMKSSCFALVPQISSSNTNNTALFYITFMMKDIKQSFLIPILPKKYTFYVLFLKQRHICYPTPCKQKYSERTFSCIKSVKSRKPTTIFVLIRYMLKIF